MSDKAPARPEPVEGRGRTLSTVLDDILAAKRRDLERSRRNVPLADLEARIKSVPPPANFSGALMGDRVRLIAEVKKASPSRGLLCPDFDPARLARTYAENGAAAISVLTEVDHFQGSLEHLAQVKEVVRGYGLPVLRKDFIFDPYQLCEARAHGADAALLIVAILSPGQLGELFAAAQGLWLQCLVEVHSQAELETTLEAGAEVIGINHRDLRTFRVDLSLTERLRPLIPGGKVVVAESGITSAADVARFRALGVNAVLVGEALVTAPDVAAKVRELAGG
ncbi:MAG: indole-3-glycerol phosphate synthase TrpC [Chloroflexi bacterium]|nr:indole-3-glycerol phosphate synthase TrpC [Chloroflexota bacterium]